MGRSSNTARMIAYHYRVEAVRGFTLGPALVSGRQTHLGTIAPRRLADLVVLDRDILNLEGEDVEQIAHAQVVMTILAGHIVYEA